MSIRSIDMQTMIPKTPEVQKIKNVELQNPQNNNTINMNKDQQQHRQEVKRVNDAKKPYNAKVDKDKQDKNNSRNKKKNDDDEKDNNKHDKPKTKIDIRV